MAGTAGDQPGQTKIEALPVIAQSTEHAHDIIHRQTDTWTDSQSKADIIGIKPKIPKLGAIAAVLIPHTTPNRRGNNDGDKAQIQGT